jgi:hypothetical protein
MELSIYYVLLSGALMFFVGYQIQKSKIEKIRRKKLRAEDMALKSDSEYLKMVQENEKLKDELRFYGQENDMLIKLQDELIKKQAGREKNNV